MDWRSLQKENHGCLEASCFQQGRERCRVKTKGQCWEERHSHGLVQAKDWLKREESVSWRSLCVDREELCQLQRSDESLAGV